MEKEIRRLQHRFDDDARTVVEAAAEARLLRERRRVALRFGVGERAAERTHPEAAHERIAAFRVAERRRLAGNQPVDVANAERVQRKAFGRGAVGLDEQRRHPLRGELILEPVNIVFRRKPLGRAAVVAQQIAHGVVVLCVRQTADELLRLGFVIGANRLDCRRQCRVRRRSERRRPLCDDLLFG